MVSLIGKFCPLLLSVITMIKNFWQVLLGIVVSTFKFFQKTMSKMIFSCFIHPYLMLKQDGLKAFSITLKTTGRNEGSSSYIVSSYLEPFIDNHLFKD